MTASDSTTAPGGALERTTGRDREGWFALLDSWGAVGLPYREIADWLTGVQGLSDWWAQKLIVEYEQARGVREPGVRRDGTFAVGASKTVAVPVDDLVAAFTEVELRERWLGGVSLQERASTSARTARFDWADGASRVAVTFLDKGAGRSVVDVQHDRLPDASTAEQVKGFWRERLVALKSLLEGER